MYDPELSLKLEQDLKNDEERLRRVEDRLGANHPWTQRVQLVTDILFAISQKENDIINSFDSRVRLQIEKEIEELCLIARKATNVLFEKTLWENGRWL